MTDANRLTVADFRRSLRAANRSPVTIKGYVGAVERFADYLAGRDLLEVRRKDVERYLGDVLDARSASTAATYYRNLQAFYKWAAAEDLVDPSPMVGLRPPMIPEKPVPVATDDDLRRLFKVCEGKDFTARRDTALFRLMLEPGGLRLAEVAGLRVDDVDLEQDVVVVLGKGRRPRAVPFGAKTGTSITRYLRLRRDHRHASRPNLWLGRYGPMTGSGIAQALERRCAEAGIDRLHPHQLRHTAADAWLRESGGDETSAMRLFGWKSREMLQRYGASNADARAHAAARRLNIGDRL